MDQDLKVVLSEEFAIEIFNLIDILQEKKCNPAIITQVLKSGTSIGANIAESLYAESKDDFIHKLKISQKEAAETRFWLKLIFRKGYIDKEHYYDLEEKCLGLIRLIASIVKSTRTSQNV